ncbi:MULTISPECIES: hypothetical protein [unclassified Clostridioides]|uniref:hypothetical protein n=1 Tax=unclassified Clostridioides TaxID=2635829 RepID=UPI001D0F6993|nr:hypothetical protein [Clostridioides sp. ES-W-0018-02]MCC0705137.1 hypothetical protein [Clostridioides sp. ES-S-0049-02]MCC0713038.1 hypothetical protein [Clostridioides sp. ES-W-0017-02]
MHKKKMSQKELELLGKMFLKIKKTDVQKFGELKGSIKTSFEYEDVLINKFR